MPATRKYGPNFFNPNAPAVAIKDRSGQADLPHVERLFVNREREMRQAMKRVGRPEDCADLYAIHGETRSGKSHFARVLVRKLAAADGGWRVITIEADSRPNVRAVLNDIVVALWRALHDLRDKLGARDVAELPNYDRFIRDVDHRKALILEEVAEESLERQEGETVTAESSVELKSGPATGKIGGKVETRAQESAKRVTRAPTDAQVIEDIRDMLDGLHQYEPMRPVLLLVDDFDLIDRPGHEQVSESDRFLDLLKSIAARPNITVILTVRTLYFHDRDKRFVDLATIGLFGDDDTRTVYRRHIEVFNEGHEVFSPEVLDLLVRGGGRRIGVFLRLCLDLWRHYLPDDGAPITEAQLVDYLDEKWSDYRDLPECMHIVVAVERAFASNTTELALDGDLRQTPLLYTVLQPVPGAAGRYKISPLWLPLFLRGAGAR